MHQCAAAHWLNHTIPDRVTHCYQCISNASSPFSPPADALRVPSLTLLSPHTVFAPGEAVRFSCSVLLGHHISDFHLYRQGVSIPLVTQRADQTQMRAELTLSDVETFQQGSYSCRYRIKGGFPTQLMSSPASNSINITVGACWDFLFHRDPHLFLLGECYSLWGSDNN